MAEQWLNQPPSDFESESDDGTMNYPADPPLPNFRPPPLPPRDKFDGEPRRHRGQEGPVNDLGAPCGIDTTAEQVDDSSCPEYVSWEYFCQQKGMPAWDLGKDKGKSKGGNTSKSNVRKGHESKGGYDESKSNENFSKGSWSKGYDDWGWWGYDSGWSYDEGKSKSSWSYDEGKSKSRPRYIHDYDQDAARPVYRIKGGGGFEPISLGKGKGDEVGVDSGDKGGEVHSKTLFAHLDDESPSLIASLDDQQKIELNMLKKLGCDEPSCRRWVVLASQGSTGKSIATDLLKRIFTAPVSIRKPSAWLNSGAKRALDELLQPKPTSSKKPWPKFDNREELLEFLIVEFVEKPKNEKSEFVHPLDSAAYPDLNFMDKFIHGNEDLRDAKKLSEERFQ